MDNKVFIKIINDSLVSFGLKKERYNFWIRKGKEVSTLTRGRFCDHFLS